MSILQNKQTPFWLFAFSVLIVLTLPTLIKDGMFMDAMLYTSVSHNLSQGIGTFWFPQFSAQNLAGLKSFHEQPPLVFGIQAIFFKIFGDTLYVERFYTFLMLCITAFLIVKFWKEIFRDNETLRPFGWLPVFLWITIPVCFWSYSNNMHENTMGVFTLGAALSIYKANQNKKAEYLLIVLSGILIFLASLSKGLPGLFPIAVPFLASIVFRNNFKKIFVQTLIIIVVLIVLYGILLLNPVSRESLSIYFFKRALHRINEDPTVGNRFFILIRLFTELLPQLILATIIFLVAKSRKKALRQSSGQALRHSSGQALRHSSGQALRHSSGQAKPDSKLFRITLFFILTGLAASAPLMLTLVQKGFYFVPALPFFAIGISIFTVQFISTPISGINIQGKKFRVFLSITIVLLVSTVIFSFAQIGKFSRNKDLLHDVYFIGKTIPHHSSIGTPGAMWNQWDLQCYLIRYFNISMNPDSKEKYFLIDKELHIEPPEGYSKVETEMVRYDLYENEER